MSSTSPVNLCAEGQKALNRTTALVQAMLSRLSEAPPISRGALQDPFEELQKQYLEQTSLLAEVFDGLASEEAQSAGQSLEDQGPAEAMLTAQVKQLQNRLQYAQQARRAAIQRLEDLHLTMMPWNATLH
ncbi:hypothetical protein WJX74_008513 [Apatococcus lobatus]|uniref:Mediator of RNA polymerase II transcription subunit 21 n=1 Tax=Apatococcus lobatus TaxID=904363 RepID=A0AAW1RB68_9CHLO